MGLIPKKNQAFVFYADLYSKATDEIMDSATIEHTNDVRVAIDDGAPANITTLPVVDADFPKRIKVSLSAAETNGVNGVSIIFQDQAGDEWYPKHYYFPIEQPVTLPAQGAPPIELFMDQLMGWLHKMTWFKKDASDTLIKVYNEAGTVVDHKATVASDGTTTTQQKFVSGP